MNTILIDAKDNSSTQNAFAEVSEGQTVMVTMQVLISEKTDERIAGTIKGPVDDVKRMISDIDDQNNANEGEDVDSDEPESEIPGGVLRSMTDG